MEQNDSVNNLMRCEKCGSNNIKIMVNVTMVVPPQYFYKLSKKAIKSKDVSLWSANWDKADIICEDCNYVHKRC